MKRVVYLILIVILMGGSLYGGEGKPKYNRIVSMSMAGDEMLFDLVERERIIAFSGHSSHSEATSVLNKKLDGYKQVDNNVEIVIGLEPDIVIAAGWLKKEIAAQLEDAGITIYTFDVPRSFEEQREVILKLAEVLDAQEKGQEIVKDMDDRLAAVQEKIKRSGKPSPRILEYSHTEGTNGKGSIFDDMIQKVYGINLAREAGIGRFAKISKEKMIEMDPEIILVPVWGVDENDSTLLDFITKDSSCQDLDAVKNNRVYVIPGKYIYIYSQYVIEGIEDLAQRVYQFEN